MTVIGTMIGISETTTRKVTSRENTITTEMMTVKNTIVGVKIGITIMAETVEACISLHLALNRMADLVADQISLPFTIKEQTNQRL